MKYEWNENTGSHKINPSMKTVMSIFLKEY